MSAEDVMLFPHTTPASKSVVERTETAQRFQVRMEISVALLGPPDARVVRHPLHLRRLVWEEMVEIRYCTIDVDSRVEEVHLADLMSSEYIYSHIPQTQSR